MKQPATLNKSRTVSKNQSAGNGKSILPFLRGENKPRMIVWINFFIDFWDSKYYNNFGLQKEGRKCPIKKG